MILNETFTMSNGVTIPKLGLGTWFIDDDKVAQAVRNAVKIGYRIIDTAQAYGNERGVGEGVRTSGIPREELFVSTKLAAEIKDYDTAVGAIEGSLEKLDLGYIDLMLIHAPQPWAEFRQADYSEGNRQAWRALEEAYRAGKIRSIGVSNFLDEDVENILEHGTVAPQANQIKVTPGNTPTDLIEYCQAKNILVESYSPLSHGKILDNPRVMAIAQKYRVSVAQLCIRYTLQLNTVSLPKASSPEHQRTNADVDFVISDDDMMGLQDLGD